MAESLKALAYQDESWPDPVEWIEKNFWIPELRGPIVLEEYHKDALREALSRDPETGLFNYSMVVWSDIKKSIKSCLAAAVGMYFAFHTSWGEIYFIANDLNQADSRVAMYFRRAMELNPDFKNVYRTRGYRMTMKSNNTVVQAIPIDPAGEAGSNADLIVWSEMWGATGSAQAKMYVEMALSPTKHGRSLQWVETYAGYREQSETLYGLYENGVTNGKRVWPDRTYHTNFEGQQVLDAYKSGSQFTLWNGTPRCSWQPKGYYDDEKKKLIPSEFNRIHRNIWASAIDTFVPIEWWDACLDTNMPVPTSKTSFVIALDAGVTDDPFAMIMVWRHPTEPDECCVHYTRRWLPPQGGKIDYEPIEKEFIRLIEEYHVVCAPYDIYQLHYFATRISKMNIVWMKAFSQTTDRLIADSQLRVMIRDRRIHHDGSHIHLRQNIMNAMAQVASEDKENRKIRIVKASKDKKVDMTVALSMAVATCMKLNL